MGQDPKPVLSRDEIRVAVTDTAMGQDPKPVLSRDEIRVAVTDTAMGQDPKPVLSRDEIRVAVIDGNGVAIGEAVRAVVANVSTASGDAVLDTTADGVGEPVAADSDVRGDAYRQTTFDLGRSRDGVYAVGRTVVDWKRDDDADYASYGYWLSVDATTPTPAATVGVFATGPEFETAPVLPASGTATYRGRAHGLHTVAIAAGEFGRTAAEFGIGEFDADVSLDADFGAMTIGGTIDNIRSTEEFVRDGGLVGSARSPRRYVLTLDAGPIAGAGSFSGTVGVGKSGAQNIASSSGSWRGRFSSRSVGGGDDSPRLAAGTFGARWTHDGGTVGQYVGSFVAGNDNGSR